MKQLIALVLTLSLLLLCACAQSAEGATDTNNTTQESTEASEHESTATSEHECTVPTSIRTANSALESLDLQYFVYGTVGYIVRETDLAPTDSWLENEAEGFYILPGRIGSLISLYEILGEENGEYIFADEPKYTVTAQDGCVIYAELERPVDMPKWDLRIFSNGDMVNYPLTASDEAPIEYILLPIPLDDLGDLEDVTCAKPVLYLYPETETEVTVKLDYKGELTCTYPTYQDGWSVTAQPDGTLTDADGKVYNYLYWEGEGDAEYDFTQGFCVAGEDTAEFLENALEQLGLTRREANEFIVYWLPLMQNNPYNVISFQGDIYTEYAPLEITPTPDSLLRVFMAWYPSETAVEITPQALTAPERNGFTVVEWGGSKCS